MTELNNNNHQNLNKKYLIELIKDLTQTEQYFHKIVTDGYQQLSSTRNKLNFLNELLIELIRIENEKIEKENEKDK